MNRDEWIHSHEQSVQIPMDDVVLDGDLHVPSNASGIVLFAHGSGSSRHSPRNQHVAEVLRAGGMGTLLFDLLTAEEEEIDMQTRQLRFDIDLLADRLIGATDWLAHQEIVHGMPFGYFGASTGAAAAMIAASQRPDLIEAIVSRGGRADLAKSALPYVQAGTLLIVGGDDTVVIELNQQAMERLHCERQLRIIPDATHLFEEHGALEQVAELARDWFARHFSEAKVIV